MRSELTRFLSQHYNSVKVAHPNEGRRKWKLRVLEQFWASNPAPPSSSHNLRDEELCNEDNDPFDSIIDNIAGGVVVRTDFSDEDAWRSFHEKLKEAEKEITRNASNATTTDEDNTHDGIEQDDGGDGGDGDDEDDEDDDGKLIKVVNPELPNERALFENLSNLGALRLFNDVDIRPSPSLPPEARRISPPHRLIDQSGWQEIYAGVDIWIYDTKSNTDNSARLVSLQGDVYGTATGDSWRARASHIYDLQLNMLTGMKINFGGMDCWDYSERKRNLGEAVLPIP